MTATTRSAFKGRSYQTRSHARREGILVPSRPAINMQAAFSSKSPSHPAFKQKKVGWHYMKMQQQQQPEEGSSGKEQEKKQHAGESIKVQEKQQLEEVAEPKFKPKYRSLTPAEFSLYKKKCEKSDGFNVGIVPGGVVMAGVILPYKPKKCPHGGAKGAKRMALIAVDSYNKRKTSRKIEFVKIIRLNARYVGGFMYYITFQAKVASPPTPMAGSPTKNFQALLYVYRGDIKVEFCRLEGKYELPKDLDEARYPCP